VDTPAHLIKGSKTLDQLSIEHFYGKAYVLDSTNLECRTIDMKALEPHQDSIEQADFLLIRTGWSQYWGMDTYFSNYTVLPIDAADWLSRFGLKGLGVDSISADKADSQDFPVHKIFLQNDTIIIENLKNLGKSHGCAFTFSCFPLNFEDADGSPVRAAAFIQ